MNPPTGIYIELTNQCNLRCGYCFHGNDTMTRPEGMMTRDTYMNILSQMRGFKPELSLHLAGESFLHPLLFDFIREAKRLGLRVGITTNGTLLSKDDYGILETGIDVINVSYTGARIDKSLLHLIKFNQWNEHPAEIYLSIVDTGFKKKVLNDFRKAMKNWGVTDVIVRPLMSWGGSVSKPQKILTRFVKRFNITYSLYLWLSGKHVCESVYTTAGVLWNGDVVPCCLDFNGDLIMGNVNREDFLDIWSSLDYLKLRETLNSVRATRKHPVCGRCRYE